MIRFLIPKDKNRKGFTLPEIIAATLIIVISAAGTYSAYIISRRFAERFKHRTMATNRAMQLMDRLRYRHRLTDPELTVGSHDITTSAVGWDLNREVDNLSVSYDVANTWFNNSGTELAADPGTGTPAFRKIVVTIDWDERG